MTRKHVTCTNCGEVEECVILYRGEEQAWICEVCFTDELTGGTVLDAGWRFEYQEEDDEGGEVYEGDDSFLVYRGVSNPRWNGTY